MFCCDSGHVEKECNMKNLLKSLIVRHRIMEDRIAEEERAPVPDSLRVRALKKMKLKLRDQIAWLEKVGGDGRPVMVIRRKPMRMATSR
jgi:hypothetical protein